MTASDRLSDQRSNLPPTPHLSPNLGPVPVYNPAGVKLGMSSLSALSGGGGGLKDLNNPNDPNNSISSQEIDYNGDNNNNDASIWQMLKAWLGASEGANNPNNPNNPSLGRDMSMNSVSNSRSDSVHIGHGGLYSGSERSLLNPISPNSSNRPTVRTSLLRGIYIVI